MHCHIAFLPLTMHWLMELCKTRSDEPKVSPSANSICHTIKGLIFKNQSSK